MWLTRLPEVFVMANSYLCTPSIYFYGMSMLLNMEPATVRFMYQEQS